MKKRILFNAIALIALTAALAAPQAAWQPAPAVSAAPLQPFELPDNSVPEIPPPPANILDAQGVQRLRDGGAKVTLAPQTGGVRFLALTPAQSMERAAPAAQYQTPEDRAAAFLQANRRLFGITDTGKELALAASQKDALGAQHLTYRQTYLGLPVYGAVMKVHLNPAGQVAVVNGLFVPGIQLSTIPARSPGEAEEAALRSLSKSGLTAKKTTLMVYRSGLAQGVPGTDYLAYEVELGDGEMQRDLVYIDARTSKVLNTITGVKDITRIVGDYNNGAPVIAWQEGDSPYAGGNPEVQAMINVSGSTYQLYENLSGGTYHSFDGADAVMQSMVSFDDPYYCPNAAWTGASVYTCEGMAADDVIAHEWSHAYTQYANDLIYQWQPGALNESYSDIFGEMVDLLNGQGTDSPNTVRTSSTCAVASSNEIQLAVSAPEQVAGRYITAIGDFSPPLAAPIDSQIVLVQDNNLPYNDACGPITNPGAIAGKIALIERGLCPFLYKAESAQLAGAAAVIIYNNVPGDAPPLMGFDPYDPAVITIPTVSITQAAGQALVAALAGGPVSAALETYSGADGGALVDTWRWLIGEDSTLGVIRDMWDPTCAGNAGKVSDVQYYCAANENYDNGGVHYNSSVPNHAFSLLVDGGAYNGQTVTGIGLNKAAAIYWRAQSVYQVPTTDFADHADALETSCADLTGQVIYDLQTGAAINSAPGQISPVDCAELGKALSATEMRASPQQCGYATILEPGEPPLCPAGYRANGIFEDDFEGDVSGWNVDHQEVAGVTVGYRMPDWQVTTNLPDVRPGSAFYAFSPTTGYGACTTADDQTSIRRLISPEITLPPLALPRLVFDHALWTEVGYDGGSLWLQVNGGDWMMVNSANFTFNGYNDLLKPSSNDPDHASTNPLDGLPAFTGMDQGVVPPLWGQSQVDLSAYAAPGDTVRLAFYFSQDGCTGGDGWYVDDVAVYGCSAPAYLPVIRH